MSPLPEERDLPAGRHAQLRDRLLREIASIADRGTARRRARWLVPAAAATAAAGVFGVAVAVNTLGPSGPPVPGHDRPAWPTTGTTGPAVVGVSPAEADRIVRGCARSYALSRYGRSGRPEPAETPFGDLALHNVLDDAAGRLALIYGKDVSLLCTVDDKAMTYRASGRCLRTSLLNGAFDVDHDAAAPGDDLPGGKPIWAGQYVAAGRVGPEVARVTVTAGGQTVEATPRNGTFVVRLVYPSTWDKPEGTEVHAYDAAGRKLLATGAVRAWPSRD